MREFRKQRAPLKYDPRSVGCRCEVCPLNDKFPVLPEGSVQSDFMVIGEGPGMQEEAQGRPFVGPSGQMLDEILRKSGIQRRSVWLSNAILCRAEVPDIKGPKRYDVPTYLAYIRALNNRRKREHKEAGKPPEEFRVIPTPLECCKPRLMNELQMLERNANARGRINGLVVIPVGNTPLQAITGKKGIMKYRGSPLPIHIEELMKLHGGA